MRNALTSFSLVVTLSMFGCDGPPADGGDAGARPSDNGGGGGGGGTVVPPGDPGPSEGIDGGTVAADDGGAGTVSFSQQVYPIFAKRSCDPCHSGGGPGKDLGGLMLDTGLTKVFRELTQEISPNSGTTRIDLKQPAKSLLLTMPLAETPPDKHPVAPFASTTDPDYQTLLRWIEQGAKQN
jgi:hypothetical protein